MSSPCTICCQLAGHRRDRERSDQTSDLTGEVPSRKPRPPRTAFGVMAIRLTGFTSLADIAGRHHWPESRSLFAPSYTSSSKEFRSSWSGNRRSFGRR